MNNTSNKFSVKDVLYEDNHVIAVNKRPSQITQGDKTGDVPLGEFVKAYIKKKYNKPGNVFLGVVHRIDRPVSGVVVFARTSKALSRLTTMFREKTVRKTYWAVTQSSPEKEKDTLIHFLQKNEKQNKSYASLQESKKSKKAELSYRLAGKSDRYTFLEVFPITGRHHQIRVQLSTIGCMIKGDLKYGAKRSNKDSSIHLHARSIELKHPTTGESLKITAPTPDEVLWNEFDKINK